MTVKETCAGLNASNECRNAGLDQPGVLHVARTIEHVVQRTIGGFSARDVLSFRAKRGIPIITTTLALAIMLCACTQQKTSAASQDPAKQETATQPVPSQQSPAVDYGPPPNVNAERAFQYTKDVVAFGPRYVSSTGHKKVEDYLRAKLKGDNLEEDKFTATTPDGNFPMTNFIAKFPGTKDGLIVLTGHYDTIYNRKDFVGANDAGSSTGILLAIADQLRSQIKKGKREGYSVWLVWFDGEEAFQHWTDTDSTYGSRHLADKWHQDGTARRIKAFMLADMIGDSDLNIERDLNSTSWLEDLIYQAATHLGYQSHFYRRETAMEDDHIPFAKNGVPVADLIDFDYGYNNAFWHTPEDTMDKLSPKSFEIVGNVMLQTVQMLDQK
jgi:glutaminyl-peptide cyclotransferase